MTPQQKLYEWVGDSALNLLARTVLIEMYPLVPIFLLERRHQRIISNSALSNLAIQKNYKQGKCNFVEREFYRLFFSNLEEAKNLIKDIIKNDRHIKDMDAYDLNPDGSVKEWIIEANKAKYNYRAECREIFKTKGILGLIDAGIIGGEKAARLKKQLA